MTTYASPRLTRNSLLVIVSLIFIIGGYIFLIGVIHSINLVSKNARNSRLTVKSSPPTSLLSSSGDTQTTKSVNENNNNKNNDSNNDNNNTKSIHHTEYEPMPPFPSTSSPSVEVIFGVVTLGHSMFGIIAITKERANLLATYSHILIMSCFIKMIFLIGKHSHLRVHVVSFYSAFYIQPTN